MHTLLLHTQPYLLGIHIGLGHRMKKAFDKKITSVWVLYLVAPPRVVEPPTFFQVIKASHLGFKRGGTGTALVDFSVRQRLSLHQLIPGLVCST